MTLGTTTAESSVTAECRQVDESGRLEHVDMTSIQATLPYLDGEVFLTDGGLETTLIFLEGVDLPHFAAYALLKHESGRRALTEYYTGHIGVAQRHGLGIVLDTPTWRANPDWGQLLGDDQPDLDWANAESVSMLLDLRAQHGTPAAPIVISGAIGPRGDGYIAGDEMTASAAAAYHGPQVQQLARTGVDVVTALTMTYPNEAIGIADAASAAAVPCAISFTVEVDGRLPNGRGLSDAIGEVDEATGGTVTYYMVNCAHPTHFEAVLESDDTRLERIRGLRSNASTASHAELDEAETLDSGDPIDLASRTSALRRLRQSLSLLGGCCGTDERHIEAIARTLVGQGGP